MDSKVVYKINKYEEDEAQHKAWMTTLNDLLCLLISFFILLYSVSSISPDEWVNINDNNKKKDLGALKIVQYDSVDTGYLKAVIDSKIKKHSEFSHIITVDRENSLAIIMPSNLFFDKKNKLSLFAISSLYFVSNNIGSIQNYMQVNIVGDLSRLNDNDYEKINDYIDRGKQITEFIEGTKFDDNKIDFFLVNKVNAKIEEKFIPKTNNFTYGERVEIEIFDN